MRRILAAVGAIGLAGLSASAATPSAVPNVESLVEKLGADSYADRESASKALLRAGSSALPALEKLMQSGSDAEARDRASTISEQIRRANEGAKMLAAPPVRLDYTGVPLSTALADLKAKTGIPLTLDIPTVKDPLRLVTVKTELVPPWQAVEEFLRVAGLKEQFVLDLGSPDSNPPTPYSGRRRTSYARGDVNNLATGSLPILLSDGTPDHLPGERASAVRVMALPPGFIGNRVIRGAGEVIFNLDVTPVSGLRWNEVAMVRVNRAEDETGRPVGISFRADDNGSNGSYNEFGMMQQMGGQVWIEDGYGGMRPQVRKNPRVVPVKLRTDDRAITRLKIFEGTVVGEVIQPNQILLTVENLSKSTGASMDGPNESKFSVLSFESKTDGRFILRVRTETMNPWQMQRMGMRMNVGQFQMEATSDGVNLTGGLGSLKFFDAAGKPVRSPMMQGSHGMDDGFRQTNEMELVFNKSNGTPAKMQVVGNKVLHVEVPFRLENVQLP